MGKESIGTHPKDIFLGLEIDSLEMSIAIPLAKAKSIREGILELLRKEEYTIRDVCKITGKIVATGPANRFARLYTTRCLVEIQEALQQSGGLYDSVMKLSREAVKDLRQGSRFMLHLVAKTIHFRI